jgi:hypothetical protein
MWKGQTRIKAIVRSMLPIQAITEEILAYSPFFAKYFTKSTQRIE